MSTIYTYELLEISWALDYDFREEEVATPIVRDESNTGEEPSPDHVVNDHEQLPIVYDAEGIPMGKSMAEVRLRERIIDAFFRKWVESHPDKYVLNNNLQDKINVRAVSIIEAKQHGAKSYKSTLAVLRLDEVLRYATKLGEMPTKKGNANQAPFEKMILMSYLCEGIGTIKLTVGVKRSNKDKVQYGISALREGEIWELPDNNTTQKKQKKKAPHKK